MKLKLYACLVVAGALVFVTQAVATPFSTAFLSVDLNGANYGGGQTVGPTQAGYQAWNTFQGFDQLDPAYNPAEDWGNNAVAGLTKVFATSQGNITARLSGVGLNFGARNRGANAGGLPGLYQDFPFAQRDGALGFGRNFIKLTLSGLTPNRAYEFTGLAREAAFNAANLADPNDPGQSFQSWTDLAALGGLDGPAAWLDANGDPDPVSYQPAVGGVNNPVPKKGRSQVAGPDSLSLSNFYFHSQSFVTRANASGVITVYTWADPNGFGTTVQGASLLNGFQLGNIPEPATLLMFGLGMTFVVAQRRRIR
jgi:PEP-CTERM motif-containing protein